MTSKKIAILAAAIAAGSTVRAQDVEPSTETARRSRGVVIEEVLVKAQKRSESIYEVPISISAFSGDTIKDLGLTDTRDLGNLVPGFSYSDSGYSVPIYSLRGVGFNEASQTASATVGVYIDEQSLAFPVFSKGTNLDLERIEVLKGPQGTLYGRNTTGGVVNYISAKPGEEFEAGVTADYSRFNTYDVQAYVSGPMSDTVGGRIALRQIYSGDGWQESLTRPGDSLGEVDKFSGRATLVWQSADDMETTFSLAGWTDRGEPQAPQAIALRLQNAITGQILAAAGAPSELGLPDSVRNHPIVDRDTEDNRVADWSDLPWQINETFMMASLRNEWAITDTNTLTVLASYSDFENDHSLIPQSGLSVNNAEREITVDTSAWSLETRLDGIWGDNMDWLVGAFYSHDDVYEYQSVYIDEASSSFLPPDPLNLNLLGPIVGNRVDTYGEQVADTQAIFMNANWQLSDSVKLTTGLRYTNEKRDFAGCTIDSPENSAGIGYGSLINALSLASGGSGGVSAGDCLILGDEPSPIPGGPAVRNAGLFEGVLEEDNVSWRLAADWQMTDTDLLYASYSRGFKSGSFPVLASSDQRQYSPATQERLDAFEVGAKFGFYDRALNVNVAAYYYDYKDKQLLGRTYDPVFGPLPILENVPESEVYGVEFEAQTNPIDGLFISLASNFLQTEVKKGSTLDREGNEVDLAGNDFNFAPEIEVTLIADYTWPLTNSLDIGVGGDISYSSETNAVITGEELFTIDAYTVANARVHLGSVDGDWKATIWARNITDEVYTSGMFETGADTIARYVGMTRTWGISLDYKFN
jgi:iron complex outermembrane receptor protein